MDRIPAQRHTRQRRIILEELRKVTSHPTAEQLCGLVRRRLPGINMSTVYRNLARLEGEGEVLRLKDERGQARYDGNSVEHVHVYCPCCGGVYDAPDPPDRCLKEYEERLEGFQVLGSRLEFTAICPRCRESGRATDPKRR